MPLLGRKSKKNFFSVTLPDFTLIKAIEDTINSKYEIIKSKDQIIELLQKQNIELKINY
jgi:hypothetical protein